MSVEAVRLALEAAYPQASRLEVSGDGAHVFVTLHDASFKGKSLLARHREVQGLFKSALESGMLHALSMDLREEG